MAERDKKLRNGMRVIIKSNLQKFITKYKWSPTMKNFIGKSGTVVGGELWDDYDEEPDIKHRIFLDISDGYYIPIQCLGRLDE